MSASNYIIEGTLRQIKEDPKLIVYDIQFDVRGLTGSIYIDRNRPPPLFNRLVIERST